MNLFITCFVYLFRRKNILIWSTYVSSSIILFILGLKTVDQLHHFSKALEKLSSVSISSNASCKLASTYGLRNQILTSNCQNQSLHPAGTEYLMRRNDMLNYLGFIIQSHSLFFCSVPKVATRTFLPFFTYLHIRDELMASFLPNSTVSQYNSRIRTHVTHFKHYYLNRVLSSLTSEGHWQSLHDPLSMLTEFQSLLVNESSLDLWKIHQDKTFPRIRLRSLTNSSIVFSDKFIRAIFVRHPLERVASAYIDKISSLKNERFSLYDDLRRKICRKFASSYLDADGVTFYRRRSVRKFMKEPCDNVVPSFKHFLEFIISVRMLKDVHWYPYSSLCKVCALKYNFIGKYETLQTDLHTLISRLNLSSTDWNFRRRHVTGRSKEQYQSMYVNLPGQILCALKDIYHYDLVLFDYSFDEYVVRTRTKSCFNSTARHIISLK